MSKLPHKALAAIIHFLALGSISFAGVIRDDVNDSNYIALGNSPTYSAAGEITFANNTDWASGTLISDEWVLTAAHVVRGNYLNNTPTNVEFTVGGTTYTADQIYLNPGYVQSNPENGNDIALVHLSSAVTTAVPVPIYTGTSELGKTGTFVGYGKTGDGLTGEVPSSATLRGGTNTIDITGNQLSAAFSSNLLLSDFDSPTDPTQSSFGSSTPTALEYLPASKDSGAGLFITILGTTYIAGVTSFALFDNDGINFNYGDVIAATRVSGSATWIESVITVPEGSPLLLLGAAAILGTGAWAFRRQKPPSASVNTQRGS